MSVTPSGVAGAPAPVLRNTAPADHRRSNESLMEMRTGE